MSPASRRPSVLRVLNHRGPPPALLQPTWWSPPRCLSPRLIHMICVNRQSYTSLPLIKASPSRLESGLASRSHAASGESYKTSTAVLPQPPVFQRSAYCVLWNYMRQNVLWQEIISTHQRPGNRLQHFTFIKAIRGSVRLDNRNFFPLKVTYRWL